MIHEETVNSTLLKLIQIICSDKKLDNFVLVGGTALALQLGHRKSVDIDLFSTTSVDSAAIAKHLETDYGAQIVDMTKGGVQGRINGVKTSLLVHPYEQVAPPVLSDKIRMASLDDIGAMKLHAVSNSGKRVKDFVDLYYLLEHRNLDDLTKAYLQKYPQGSAYRAISGMIFFDDADKKNYPKLLQQPFNWENIQERLSAAARSPKEVFKREVEQNKRMDEPKIVQQKRSKGKGKRL